MGPLPRCRPWTALGALQAGVAGLVGPLVVAVARASRGRPMLWAPEVIGAVVVVEAVRARVAFNGLTWVASTYAIKFGPTIADTWAPYLTMSEALRIAAGVFRRDKPTSCCA